MDINILVEDILEYKKKKKLAFFVGAGVSAVSNYPSWYDLVKDMADGLNYKYELDAKGKAIFSSEGYLRIPQVYYDNKGEAEYFKKINDVFSSDCKPNEVHDLIMQLNPYHILTTNYDTLLEQAANKYGINYSVINHDEKISVTPTKRYILKVHGDFENNKFVLKEQDYLDYEKDYVLIDTVVKTIIATNLIVFIGYGLNDYNIKLILNWVKQVQGDTFIEPIFIYTEKEELSDEMITYYKRRGIRIIDTNCFVKSGEFKDKYIAALKKITNYNKADTLKNDIKSLEYLYEKLVGLSSFEYVRTRDIETLFEGKYYIDQQNYVVNRDSNTSYIEMFYKLLNKVNELDEDCKAMINVIQRVFEKANIKGIHGTGYIYSGGEENVIHNKLFWSKYDEIEKYLQETYNSVGELYDAAYGLFATGRLEESYLVFTDLLSMAKEYNDWILYFICQINRYFVYQTIMSYERYFSGINVHMAYGDVKLFNDEFINSMVSEMNGFQFEELYYELPAEIREKYTFLKRLCTRNIYSQDIIDSFEGIYQIEQGIFKRKVTLAGQAEYEKIKMNMIDAVKFIYDNKLLYSHFAEHKNYIRNTLINVLKGEYSRMKFQIEEKEFFSNPHYKITTQDFVLIYKNFKREDILYLESIIDFEKFDLSERQDIENIIWNEFSYLEANYSSSLQGNKVTMYFMYKEEYNSLCYLAWHFISSYKLQEKIVKCILNYIAVREINECDKLCLISKYIQKIGLNNSLELIIEDFLLEKLLHYKKYPNAYDLDNQGRFAFPKYCKVILDYNPGYKSKKLSNLCNESLPIHMKQYLKEFSEVLLDDAKKFL